MSTADKAFSSLQLAHGHIVQRLADFFNRDDFQHYRFVVNEFDLFTLFILSSAWLRVAGEGEDNHAPLMEFHKAQLVVMVDRMLANEVAEVEESRADALMDMVQNIASERLRDYFQLMQQASQVEGQQPFASLVDTFLQKCLNYDDAQLLTVTTALVSELFDETIKMLDQSTGQQS